MMDKSYVADFETTTEPTYEAEGRVRVWASSARNIKTLNTVLIRNNLDDFMDWMLSLKGVNNVYFHNLKFDGSFIIDWLFRHGWEHLGEDEFPTEGKFNTLITDMGAFFAITIFIKRIGRGRHSRWDKVTVMDSLKKLPFRAEKIAKAFNLEVLKGSIDYDKHRPVGYKLTKTEKDYILNDTYIIAKALQIQMNEGQERMTIASDAMTSLKETIGRKQWDYMFPKITLEMDDFMRRSYRGGWTYLKPEYSGITLGRTVSFDVNSLYPFVMRNKKLPYGFPMYYKGEYEPDDKYPLYIQRVRVILELKEGHLPTLQVKDHPLFKSTEYVTTTFDEKIEMTLTKVDIELMFDHYDVIDIDYIDGYKFRGASYMFSEYIDYWADVKANTEGAKRTLAKLMLNSAYGKFAMNPRKSRKIPYFEDDKVKYYQTEEKEGDPVYTPVASFITAYAREVTIRSAQRNYDRFIYADTDSMHLLGWDIPDNIEYHESKLGAWKDEGYATRSKFLRPKTYLKLIDGEKVVKCAGMPDDMKERVTFENFELGQTYTGKLMAKVVEGGTLLKSTDFTIKK